MGGTGLAAHARVDGPVGDSRSSAAGDARSDGGRTRPGRFSATQCLRRTSAGCACTLMSEPERTARVERRIRAIETQTPRQLAEERAPALVSTSASRELVDELIEVMAQIR